MMAAIMFDTHTFVKKLMHAGASEELAELEAETFAELIRKIEDNHVTKSDLRYELAKQEAHIIIRLATITGVMLGIAVAVLALIIKL